MLCLERFITLSLHARLGGHDCDKFEAEDSSSLAHRPDTGELRQKASLKHLNAVAGAIQDVQQAAKVSDIIRVMKVAVVHTILPELQTWSRIPLHCSQRDELVANEYEITCENTREREIERYRDRASKRGYAREKEPRCYNSLNVKLEHTQGLAES